MSQFDELVAENISFLTARNDLNNDLGERGNTDSPRAHSALDESNDSLSPEGPSAPEITYKASPIDKIKAYGWFMTWNNYTEEERKTFYEWAKDACTTCRVNPEIGKNGTPHLQGSFWFKNQRYGKALRKLWPKAHFEKTKHPKAAMEYCAKAETKDETKEGLAFDNSNAINKGIDRKDTNAIKKLMRQRSDPLEGLTLRPFQQFVMDKIKEKADSRRIWWINDKIGLAGKTSLAIHAWKKFEDDVIYCERASANNAKNLITGLMLAGNKVKVVIWDVPRSAHINNEFYVGLESIKNGFFVNEKYDNIQVAYDPPHVFVFANQLPNTHMLSADRLKILDLQKDYATIEAADELEEFF